MSYNPAEKLLEIYPYNLFADIFSVRLNNNTDYTLLYHLYPPALMYAVSQLDSRKKEVILMRYLERMTLERVGFRFGMTRERVRQIEAHAIRELRNPNLIKSYKYAFVPETMVGSFEKTLDKAMDMISDIRTNTMTYQVMLPEVSENEYEDVMDDTQDLTEQHIKTLGLTSRTQNLLLRADIRNIRDLTMMSSKEIMWLRNAGAKTLEEIKEKLHTQGMKLADEVDDE